MIVKLLLVAKASVNAADKDGSTPLYEASGSGYTEVAKLLLAAQADVNAVGQNGVTPLFAASAMGAVETVKLLLDHKADVNAKATDLKGKVYTPLSIAKEQDHAEVVRLLKAAGAQ